MTTLFRAPWILIATALMVAFAPQGREGQKALVYCPVDVDASGCSTIVKALTDGGEFAGGVDRGYTGADGTVDLKSVDLSAYSVLVVPSLADDANEHPYNVLRDRDVAERVRAVLRGRQVFFSGTPDQGASIDSRAQKDALIRNLAHWAAGKYASAKGPGIVVLQDQSDDVDARYAWAKDLVGYRVAARTAPSTYSRVQALTAAGREMLASAGLPLSYANMASFGLSLPDGGPAVASDALGQGANQDLVMVTMEAANFASTAADVRFAFLSPLGTGSADPSSFDASATPVVEICAWTNNACSGALTARFTIAPTGTNLPLTVNAAAGRFEASWNLLNAAFTTRKTYRIQVLQGTEQLGFALVDVTRGRWALTRPDGSLAPLVSANTLPVTFTMSPATTQNQAPTSNITAPATGTVVNEGQSITFNGTGTDPEDGTLAPASLVWTSDKAGQIGTGASFSTSTLAAGKHVITLKATDSQGLTGTATIDVIVNALPVATITAPASGSSFGAGTTITFTGTGTDAEDGALANGSLVWTSDVAGSIGTGASINVGTLAVGSHTITLTVTDSRGATRAASITISVIANHAPQASITVPATGTVVNAGQSITFTGTGTDLEDGNLAGASLVWTSDKAGQIGTGATFGTTTLAAGSHTITLTATDTKGLSGSASITVIVNAPPAVSISEPVDGFAGIAGEPITFKGSAVDPEDGPLSGASLVWTSSGLPSQTGVSFTGPLPQGTHVLTLTATDSKGFAASKSITITGNARPLASISAPATGSVANAGDAITFTGGATDVEDGTLTGTSLVWTSDKAGQIGTGATFSTSTLAAGKHVITLTATDSKGATNTATIDVIVNALPVALITSPSNNASFPNGATIAFSGTGTDAEDGTLAGASLVWTSEAGPLGTGPTISVNTLGTGTHTITLTATDARGATGRATIIILVAANRPPEATITAPASGSVFNQGQSITFTGGATDPEDGTLGGASLVWRSDKAGQIGTGTTFSTSTLTFGKHVITLTATDSKGLTHAATIDVIVNGLPSASITSPANGTTFPSGATITFSGTGTDPDDGPLTGTSLVWTSESGSLGTGATINVSSLASGNHTITLTVTDSRGATATASITISVAANQAPTAAITAPSNNAVFQLGQPVSFTGTGTDPEDGTLGGAALVWTSDRAGQFATGGSPTVPLSAGTHHITLMATDSKGATGTATITIVVNTAPVATITSPANGATFTEGQAIDFVATATDVDEGTLTGDRLVWTSDIAGPLGTGEHLSVSTLHAGTHHITLAANDHQGGAASAQITIVVTAPNQPPVVNITAPAPGTIVGAGSSVTFAATAQDPEDGPLTGASVVWTNDAGTQVGTGLSISAPVPQGAHVFTVTATDSKGLKTTATVTVIGNAPPTASITSPANGATFQVGQAVNFRGTGADAEDGQLTGTSLVWRDGATQIGTGTDITVSSLSAGPHTITLTATDSRNASAVASVSITITANQAPVPSITAPANGLVVNPGQSVTFTGSATDLEDGPLPGTALQWSSSQDGVLGTGASIVRTLSGGPHTITLKATDSHGAFATRTVDILVLRSTMSIPPTISVPIGSTISMPIQIIDPAPAGGLVVTITSDNSAVAAVQTANVTIPAGQLTAGAQLQGVAPGNTVIRVSAPGYLPVSSQASVGGNLNIVQGSASFAAGRTSDITIQLEKTGVPLAAPPGGLSVTLTPTNPSCVAVTSPVTIPAGLVSTTATLSYGGTSTLPCNTTVTASVPAIPLVTTDQMSVSVQPMPSITLTTGPIQVGAGTRAGNSGTLGVSLSAPAPAGGLDLTLASADGNVARIALQASGVPTGVSAPSMTVTIPAGATSASFVVDGMEGQSGTVALTASAPAYTSGTSSVRVRPLAYQFSGLSSTTSLSTNSTITAQLCTANDAGTDVQTCASLPIRPGGTPLTVTFTNTTSSVGQLAVVGGSTGQTATATIGVGQSATLSSGTGTVQFDPLGAGTTTVSITGPGVVSGPTASRLITVSAPAITLTTGPIQVGAGTRAGNSGTLGVSLGAPAPAGGLDLTLASADGNVARIALQASGVPTGVSAPSMTVTIPAGQSSASFVVDGMEGQSGTVALTASAPAYTSGTSSVRVRPLAYQFSGLSSTTSLSTNSTITAQLCTANDAGTDVQTCASLPIRPGGTPLTVTFTNTTSSVGQLAVVGGSTGQTATATIGVGQSATLSSGTGTVQFDPLGAGTTTVSITGPGVVSGPTASRLITVSAPAITLTTGPIQVGAGTRAGNSGTLGVSLGAPAPAGGLDLTLASADGNVARIALQASGVPTGVSAPSMTVTIPAGQSSASFVVDGMEGQSGTVVLTASAPAYTSGTSSVRVRPLAYQFSGLSTTTSLSTNSTITAQLCTANDAGTDVQTCASLPIRPGGTPLTVTFTNTTSSVGQLAVVGGSTGQTATATIGVGQSATLSSGTGTVQFDPLGAGTTTVSITGPGVVSGPTASRLITVSAPAITLTTGPIQVGAGTRAGNSGTLAVSLGAPAPAGGLDLTLASSNGNVAGVALSASGVPGATVLSAPSVTITIPAGQTSASFVVDGLEGQDGTVTLTASGAGFTSGQTTVRVRPLALQYSGLSSTTAAATNSVITAQLCYANDAGTDVQSCSSLPIRPGGTPLTITFSNSASAVGQLVVIGGGSGQTVTSTIGIGQSATPSGATAGAVQFDPLAVGTTTVSVTRPGVISGPSASRLITVNP